MVNTIELNEAKCKTEFKTTEDTTYLALTGELWNVFGGDFEENWSRYNGIALYLIKMVSAKGTSEPAYVNVVIAAVLPFRL